MSTQEDNVVYIVLNTRTEESSSHKTWQAAFKAARKHPPDEVVIVERDRDGERTYDLDGRIIARNW